MPPEHTQCRWGPCCINRSLAAYVRPVEDNDCTIWIDPLSPLLFNFVADTLSAMLDRARAARHIKGVVAHLIPRGCRNCNMQTTQCCSSNRTCSIALVKLILLSFKSSYVRAQGEFSQVRGNCHGDGLRGGTAGC